MSGVSIAVLKAAAPPRESSRVPAIQLITRSERRFQYWIIRYPPASPWHRCDGKFDVVLSPELGWRGLRTRFRRGTNGSEAGVGRGLPRLNYFHVADPPPPQRLFAAEQADIAGQQFGAKHPALNGKASGRAADGNVGQPYPIGMLSRERLEEARVALGVAAAGPAQAFEQFLLAFHARVHAPDFIQQRLVRVAP